MSDHKDIIIKYFEDIIEQIREDKLDIVDIGIEPSYIEHSSCFGGDMIKGTVLTGSGTLTLKYSAKTPKPKKTQQEIYKELFEGKYEFYITHKGVSEEEATIIANSYASACTVDAWRDQYEVH